MKNPVKLALATTGVIAALLMSTAQISAQTGANVLVVANAASEGSVRIANHYAKARSLPSEHVLRLEGLPADAPDTIERIAFERLIQAPIGRWLTVNGAQDRIHFIVLTKGIPIRVRGTVGRRGTVASVDSELTLLYRRLTGQGAPPAGPIQNPYFLGDQPISDARQYSHEGYDLYLVSRLDGFTVDDAIALVDRSVKASNAGRFLLDERAPSTATGNALLRTAAERLKAAGFGERTEIEPTSQVLTNQKDVLGYFSWGSNDPNIKVRTLGLGFVPGALAATFVSTDGRTFREPPAAWTIGTWPNKASFYAGSPQSLTGDLIREGVTGTAGHVAEPFLDGTVRPDILFPAYAAGRTLAEAFYLALRYVSWQTVVIGDPLCAPFSKGLTKLSEPPMDPTTELPGWLSASRVRSEAVSGVPEAAVRAFVRGDTRIVKGDRAGARQDLERATALYDGYSKAQGVLASLYDQDGHYDLAYERYRKQLAKDRQNVAALNNLAYGLAVRKSAPREALPLAQRAQALEPKNPLIADTLGWVYFLMGDHQQAVRFLGQAAQAAPRNSEIRLHLAEAFLAAGRLEDARKEFAAAGAADPNSLTTDSAKALAKKLQ